MTDPHSAMAAANSAAIECVEAVEDAMADFTIGPDYQSITGKLVEIILKHSVEERLPVYGKTLWRPFASPPKKEESR